MKIFNYLVVLLLVASCKKVQPALNDGLKGCDCAHEVNARFLMEELADNVGSPDGEKRTDTDTTYSNKNVRFYALEDNAEYTWIIGAEILHNREIYRHFDASLNGQTLPMKLIVKKKPNLLCFPQDNGMDTVTRHLTVSGEPFNYIFDNYTPRFEGVFRMKDPNMPDSINLTLELSSTLNGMPYERLIVTNFNGQGNMNYFGDNVYKNYRQRWFYDNGYQRVTIKSDVNGLVELDMIPQMEDSGHRVYHFKGRKLN